MDVFRYIYSEREREIRGCVRNASFLSREREGPEEECAEGVVLVVVPKWQQSEMVSWLQEKEEDVKNERKENGGNKGRRGGRQLRVPQTHFPHFFLISPNETSSFLVDVGRSSDIDGSGSKSYPIPFL